MLRISLLLILPTIVGGAVVSVFALTLLREGLTFGLLALIDNIMGPVFSYRHGRLREAQPLYRLLALLYLVLKIGVLTCWR